MCEIDRKLAEVDVMNLEQLDAELGRLCSEYDAAIEPHVVNLTPVLGREGARLRVNRVLRVGYEARQAVRENTGT